MKRALLFSLLVLATACSSTTVTPAVPSDGADAGDGDQGPANAAEQVGPGAPFATYVILGDSISDKGGDGPFFYDLLGQDLKSKLGDVTIEKHSKEGSVSKNLLAQVQSIPSTLKGPVAVSVTIGGNDMQYAAIDILGGKDATDRETFKQNLAAAYDELMKEDRFGAGVKVTVFYASIYDPTDGQGNFAEAKCPDYLAAIPKTPTTTFWDNWNADYDGVMAKYGAAAVKVDIRAKFHGHGVGTAGSWFADDCIHPNTPGHEAIRELFFSKMEP
jgi:lysophospholipase L1-like esterase